MLGAERETSPRGADWLLALQLVAPSHLMAMLTDGLWARHAALAVWPADASGALPPEVLVQLPALHGQRLRLQLPPALDAWPWEAELAASLGPRAVVPRFVDAPLSSAGAPQADAPAGVAMAPCLVQQAPLQAVPLSWIAAGRAGGRPFVVVDHALEAGVVRALELLLHRHWREGRWLSDALAAALAELPAELSAACRLYGDGLAEATDSEQGRRPVTAVSVDVVQSTPLLQAGDEAYARQLQRFYRLCEDIVADLQGHLPPPQGNDGLMGYFGFPLAMEHAAESALRAAWRISQRSQEAGLLVRIGVASGNAAIRGGHVFGTDVHLAARLREAAEPGQVLVARATRLRVGAAFGFHDLRLPRPLKDYADVQQVHVLATVLPAGASVRTAPHGPFVGRREELRRLRSAWQLARQGRLQWCAVVGEPGIGKSRLLHEFARGLQQQGVRCVFITGQPPSAHSPLAALVDGRRRLQPRPDGGQAEQGADPHPEPGPHPGRDDLLDWLRSLAATGPCCLLIDDAHWLDPSSVDLLRRLRQAEPAQPLLVVSGERADAMTTAMLSHHPPIELQGLADAEAAELAAAVGCRLSERVRRRIVERAAGVPLFLEEEAQRVLQQPEPDAAQVVPSTLEDLLMVRLDALGPNRALAQVMAVLGREGTLAQLEALLSQDDELVQQALRRGSIDSLLASGLLLRHSVDGQPGWRFKHALIQDAAYASMWEHDRQRLHGLCANLMERHLPGLARQRPEQWALHLDAAGRVAQARDAWQAAAQLAAARHAHAETIALARRALALPTSAPPTPDALRADLRMHLLIASAQIALRGYGSAEVEAAYHAAQQVGAALGEGGHTARVALGLEACYVMRGDLARAGELARRLVAGTAWHTDGRLALQARWALANVQFHQGDWRAALAGFDDCLAHYEPGLHRRSSVQDTAVMCLGYSSWIHFELGHADEARRRIQRLLDLAGQLAHPFSLGVAHGFAASVLRLLGDTEGAWPHAQAAVQLCEEGEFQVWRAHAWMVRGQLRADRGETEAGDADMLRGYAAWEGGHARISCATYLITRAEILLRQHRSREASEHAERALQISEAIGERHYRAELLRVQGLCAWQAGALAQARQGLQRAHGLAADHGRTGLALRCALSLGALEAAQGLHHAALQRLRAICSELQGRGHSRDLAWAEAARQAWAQGRTFSSRAHTPWEPT